MTLGRKTVALIYTDEENPKGMDFIDEILYSIFEDAIVIKRYYSTLLKEGEFIEADGVLVNGDRLLPMIQPHLRHMRNLVVLTKSISRFHLPKLLSIPRDTDVLLVNDTPSSTMDALFMFYKLGMVHFNLIPYDKRTPDAYKNISYAVTTGEAHLVPEYIENVIDMGYRRVGFDALLKAVDVLELNTDAVNRKLIAYADTIVTPYMDSQTNFLDSYIKNCLLNQLSSDSGLALLAFDTSGSLLFENQKAKDIFSEQSPDKALAQYLKGAKGSTRDIEIRSQLVSIGEKNYLMDQLPIGDSSTLGTMISLKDEEGIRQSQLFLNKSLKEKGVYARHTFADILSCSSAMKACIALARQAALTDHTVLLQGESGTGKELFAQSIHNLSSRSLRPFLAINCAALPESLLESELFGYAPGAFTGAQKNGKAGLFEQAHTGTIFLDEIGDISPRLQSRLLRVLQEKQFMRIGSDRIIDVDVRIIAATNRDLNAMVEKGAFRKDLFYRLCVIPITIPPLRQRTQDILPLFHYFLKKEHCQASSALTPAQEAALTSYSWPGNVRELENAASYLQALGTLPPNVLLPYEKENSPMSSTPMSAPMEKTSGPKVVGSMTEASPWESPDPSIDRKRTSLSTKEVLICKILSLIYSRAQVYSSTGRTVILTELRRDGFLISDNQLRRLLSELREEAFISYGKGRSGILLTEAGRKRVEAVLPTSL